MQYKDTTRWWEASLSLLSLAEEENNISLRVQALYHMAQACYYKNQIEDSMECIMEGITVCEGNQFLTLEAQFYNLLGVILTKQSNEVRALDYFLKATACLEGTDDYLMLATVYNNIASLYVSLEDYEIAMKCFDNVDTFLDKHYEFRGSDLVYITNQVNYLIQRCFTCCSRKEYTQAFECLWELQKYDNIKEVSYLKQYFNVANAKIGYQIGEVEQFKSYVQQILKGNDTIQFKSDILIQYIDIFEYLIDCHELELAKQLLSMIEADLGSANSDYLFLRFYKALAYYYCEVKQEDELEKLYIEYYRLLKVQENKINNSKVMNIKTKQRLHHEVEEKHRIEKEVTRLKLQKELDALTTLPNRYRMNEVCDDLFQKALLAGETFGVLILDIDFFKEYNDYHGHLEGDNCIKMVANCIRRNAQNLFCSRFGGDEFFLIGHRITQEKIFEVAKDIQESVVAQQYRQPVEVGYPYVTVSQGICVGIPKEGQTYSDYIHAADMALYRGKNESRNAIFLGNLDSH